MTDPLAGVEPVDTARADAPWSRRLIIFLRLMAVAMMAKGLYHWSMVIGVGDGAGSTFDDHAMSWQSATIFFAVIDLVAAVGLWLAAAWGGVVWLTAAISMLAVELFFPQIFGGQWSIILTELAMIAIYVVLALLAARERPE